MQVAVQTRVLVHVCVRVWAAGHGWHTAATAGVSPTMLPLFARVQRRVGLGAHSQCRVSGSGVEVSAKVKGWRTLVIEEQ